MKKLFLIFAVFVMAICAKAQTNQYFWYNGNLLMGNTIAQIDSVTFGNGESTDTLHILLPRTIIKEVHDTVTIAIHDTIYINKCVPNGAVEGAFSVSANKQVFFSKGNLQYQASTGIWRFAENQYDMIGYGNTNISSTYTGWIDFFCWGTSGYDNKYPYLTDNTFNSSVEYGNGDNDIAGTNYDWGVYNAISNGGNSTNMWRTLTKSEWNYLLKERANASGLYSVGNVNGISGLILLPDGWTPSDSIVFISKADAGTLDYSLNVYTETEWGTLEKLGAIFLPAGGSRTNGMNYNKIGEQGEYWSSSYSSTKYAYFMRFSSLSATAGNSGSRDSGKCVRLVQDVE